ncbi:MAG: hypothetical protein ABI112_02810 [Terracoccus sp.]
MLTEVNDASVPNDAAVTNASRASQSSAAKVFSRRRPRFAQFCHRVSGVDIDKGCS